MLEVEIKILNQSHKDWKQKLIDLGAKKVFDDLLIGIIYDDKNNTIRNSKNLLRLRKEGTKSILCFKESIQHENVKMAHETEVEVSDFEKTKEILEKLGFLQKHISEKHRVSYKLNNVRIEFEKFLGEYNFVPEFIELESSSSDEIYRMAELLGFSKKECKNMTGKEVIDYYAKTFK